MSPSRWPRSWGPLPWRSQWLLALMEATATFDQDSFRGRNDDGSETTATWKANANINWTQAVDENFRVRFLIQETAGVAESNFKEDLQYNLNGAGWNDVDDSTSLVVRMSLSGNFAHGDDTTQQVGAGTFVVDNDGMNETNPPGGTMVPDFAGNDETEFEFCVQIRGADVNDADTVELRITKAGTALNSYTNTPSITVEVRATQQTIAATAVGVVALTRGLSFLKSINATTVGAVGLDAVPTFIRAISAAATGVASLSASRLVIKAISAVASGVASLSKVPTFTKAIEATATGFASLTRALTFMRAVAATAIGAVSLSTATTFVKAIAVTAVGAAALVANLIGGAGAATAKLRRRVGRLIVNPGTLLRR